MFVTVFDYDIFEGIFQVGLICFERQLNYSQVASILYDEYKVRLQSVDALIIRPPVDIQVTNLVNEKNKAEDIINRFPHLSFHLLYSFDYHIKFSKNLNDAVDNAILNQQEEQGVIRFLCQNELEQFLLNSSAIFKSPENTIYRTPSNEYSHAFLRVGNIQTNRHVLDAIFFWTIPHLKNAGSILTDSWSISSIALNIARLLCRYDNNVKIDTFHVNMLTTHYDGEKKIDRETESNLISLTYENKKNILFLISAVKTSKSLQNIRKIFSNLVVANQLDYVAIYRLINVTGINYLCDLSNEFSIQNSTHFDSYGDPPKDESVIEIDDKVFFPLNIKESELQIKVSCTKENEAFFRKYEGHGIFSVHRDAYYFNRDKFRHHGIYIDVMKMLQCEAFNLSIKLAVERSEKPPSLIIYPPHEAGEKLVTTLKMLFEEKFHNQIETFFVLDIDFLSRKVSDPLIVRLAALKSEDSILIVDDVSTTGARLKNYQKKLRYVYIGQIHYFIGVARPDKKETWDKRVRDLEYRPGQTKHIVTCIEKVIIPDWDEKSCPWCCEKEIIKKVASNPSNAIFPLTTSLKRRYFSLLKGSENGLTDNVFFSINENQKPSFQGGSIFAKKKEISEADLITIVAASIQNIRNNGGYVEGNNSTLITLQAEYPHFKIIRIEDYMGKNSTFNEALVRAAILRVATRSELHAKSELNRKRQINEVLNFLSLASIEKSESSFFIYELYLALKDRKLPKPNIDKKLIKILEDAFNIRE